MNTTSISEEKIPDALVQSFIERYGARDGEIVMIASPARINIIGEHIDYNGGVVFPAAIDRFLYVLLRKRTDTTIIYDDIRFPGSLVFSSREAFVYKKENGYANYLNGMLSMMQRSGYEISSGFEALFFSQLPAGGGISSSAALEIGFGKGIAELFAFTIDSVELAKMGQASEHSFMNVQCGIMDQFSIAMGKKGYAMVLDTVTLAHEYVPLILDSWRIVVMNTNKQRTLADSKYNERRSECMQALALLQKVKPIDNLCALTSADLDVAAKVVCNDLLFKRVRHCITEHERVHAAAAALKAGNLPLLGTLLKASHDSLRYDYEVTGHELDTLVGAAHAQSGCLGARMTGAGFGGCAIAVVKKDNISDFTASVGSVYEKETGLTASFFTCEAADGAHRIF